MGSRGSGSRGRSGHPNDEGYTSRESAEHFINLVFDKIKDLKIICPCDSPESEIYKLLQERGCNVECCLDMGNTDYSKYDIVITNPPFSVTGKGAQGLTRNNIKFYIMSSWITGVSLTTHPQNIDIYLVDYGGFKRSNNNDRIIWKYINITSLTNCSGGRDIIKSKPKISSRAIIGSYEGIYVDYLTCNYLAYKGATNNGTNLKYLGPADEQDKQELG